MLALQEPWLALHPPPLQVALSLTAALVAHPACPPRRLGDATPAGKGPAGPAEKPQPAVLLMTLVLPPPCPPPLLGAAASAGPAGKAQPAVLLPGRLAEWLTGPLLLLLPFLGLVDDLCRCQQPR